MTEAVARRGMGERLAWWGLLAVFAALFAALPAWRGYRRAPVESQAISTAAFTDKVEAMVRAYATGETVADNIPVVRPPAGDVYVLARRWQFYPVVELQAGKTYRLYVASVDILHGFHLNADLDFLLVPGTAHSFTLTPAVGQRLVMQCSDYCGLQHNLMKATVRILPK